MTALILQRVSLFRSQYNTLERKGNLVGSVPDGEYSQSSVSAVCASVDSTNHCSGMLNPRKWNPVTMGLELPWSLVFTMGLGTSPPWILRDDCIPVTECGQVQPLAEAIAVGRYPLSSLLPGSSYQGTISGPA